MNIPGAYEGEIVGLLGVGVRGEFSRDLLVFIALTTVIKTASEFALSLSWVEISVRLESSLRRLILSVSTSEVGVLLR